MTRMLKKVAAHIRRYNPYSVYAAKSELKGEVASSYLTWMWWILDPVLFMFVYVFITVVVFKSTGKYLPVVVIIGLTVWNFFNKTVMISVKIVNAFRGIVSKIYIPKYMLILEKLYVNFFKMLISFGIVAGFAAAYRLPPTIHLLECILLVFLLLLLTLACWERVHPSLITIPVNWNYKVSYGLLYAKDPTPEAAACLKALKKALALSKNPDSVFSH